eukprot:4278747-Prymnesium_polylepis.1
MSAARDSLVCGHNNRQGDSVSCVKSAVKSAVNSHTLHHLCRVHYATHGRYIMEIHPINI